MNVFDDCPTETRSVVGEPSTGEQMTVIFTPNPGELWEILFAKVSHDDAAAPIGTWRFFDGIFVGDLSLAAALAADTQLPFYTPAVSGCLYIRSAGAVQQALFYQVDTGATDGAVAYLTVTGRVLRGIAS